MKYLLPILLFLGIALPASAQSEPALTASTNKKQVGVLDQFVLTFTFNNLKFNNKNFNPPSMADFIVVGGPNISSEITGFHGKFSSTYRLSYVLQPRKTGVFTIGPATFTYARKKYSSEPVTVEVLQKKPAAGDETDTGEPVVVRTVLEPTKAVVGQQLKLSYKVYTRTNIEHIRFLEQPSYRGFYSQNLRYYDNRLGLEELNGVQYTTQIVSCVALFPQQTGTLTIEPVKVQAGISEGNRRSSFPFLAPVRNIILETGPVQVEVLAPPQNDTFSGAVGKYSAKVEADRTQLSTDDAIALKMVVTGSGDIKRVQAPRTSFPPSFDVYEAKVLNETWTESQGALTGRKEFEVLAIPKEPGSFSAHWEFTYYDTDSAALVTLQGEPLPLTVSRGSSPLPDAAISPATTTAEEDIRFIKLETTLKRKGHHFIQTAFFWSLMGLPLLFLGIALLVRRQKLRQAAMDPASLRKKKARKLAQRFLAESKACLEEEQPKRFFDALSRALLGYVSNKMNIPTSELTKENVREKLQRLQVSEKNINNFMKVLEACELALFAGTTIHDNKAQLLEEGEEVITRIESEID